MASKDDVGRIIVATKTLRGSPLVERKGKLYILRILPLSRLRKLNLVAIFFVTSLLLLVARPDVAHVHSSLSLRGSCVALKLARTPFLLDVRDRLGGAKSHKYSDLVAGCSLGILDDLQVEGARNTIYIPIIVSVEPSDDLFVKSECSRLGIPSPYILFIGDLAKTKGIERLVAAFGILRVRLPEYSLVIIGSNPYGYEFRSQGIRYLGELPHRTAMAVLKGSSMLVLPSETEGMPTVCLEAVALGKKVVFPPGILEFKELRDFALESLDPEHIAEVSQRVLENEVLPSLDLRQNSPERVANLFYQSYLGILSSRKRRARRSEGDAHGSSPIGST